jgi:hypothetical protein
MLAKFPASDPPQSSPLLLGLEFFVAHHAFLNIPPPPQTGYIHL